MLIGRIGTEKDVLNLDKDSNISCPCIQQYTMSVDPVKTSHLEKNNFDLKLVNVRPNSA